MPVLTDMTIVMPTYNDEPSTLRLVLKAAASEPVEPPVIVVDMSTDDRLRNVCDEFGDRISYHHYPESTGVSDSRNRCVSLASTRYITQLDSDVLPNHGWLDPLARKLREPDVAIVGSRILPQWLATPPRLFKSRAAAPLLSIFDLGEETIDVIRLIGGSYSFDRELVSDPPFDLALGRKPGDALALEENALCETAGANGFRVIYVADSVAHHMIPKERLTWRFVWSRARVTGRERRLAGKAEPLPRPPRTMTDRAFQLAVAPAVLAGVIWPDPRVEMSLRASHSSPE
jgi:glycosyltransferase involved in cell wall biosynthesis